MQRKLFIPMRLAQSHAKTINPIWRTHDTCQKLMKLDHLLKSYEQLKTLVEPVFDFGNSRSGALFWDFANDATQANNNNFPIF